MGDLAEAATDWCDRSWDEDRALLWNPPGSFEDDGLAAGRVHMVPQSGWYAAGLLLRGDRARATRVLGALCDLQYDDPGTVWHGTFARFAEWRRPRAGAVEWVDYDPNWRQFLGTTFAVILRTFELDETTERRLRDALALAVDGEPAGRVSPRYSNIALMRAWLDVERGRTTDGEAYAREIVDLFRRHGAFEEYGSPTYYGIDLLALALWRSHSSSEHLRGWGRELEAALWHDIARWYHPGLRNLCGPYSRAYGMDMAQYASLLGLWLWGGLGREAAPFPDVGSTFAHSHDLAMGPMVDLLGVAIPRELHGPLRRFDGTRLVRQQITDARVATGWLAEDVMFGAESGASYRAQGQYTPVTAHWRRPDGDIGWLRVRHDGAVDASVTTPGELVASYAGDPPEVLSSHPFPGELADDGDGRLVLRWRG